MPIPRIIQSGIYIPISLSLYKTPYLCIKSQKSPPRSLSNASCARGLESRFVPIICSNVKHGSNQNGYQHRRSKSCCQSRRRVSYSIEVDNCTRKVAFQDVRRPWIATPIHEASSRLIWTRKLQLRRTAAHYIKAEIFAWKHLFVRAGLNLVINHKISTFGEGKPVAHRLVELLA
jgi:hypothetical protein